MKKYEEATIEVVEIKAVDVIATSEPELPPVIDE